LGDQIQESLPNALSAYNPASSVKAIFHCYLLAVFVVAEGKRATFGHNRFRPEHWDSGFRDL
jgi:hypothetical protein